MKEETKHHTLLSWKAPEFHYHKKGQWWFPLQALLTLGGAAFFVLTKQYIVAIIIILGAIIIYRLAHAEPEVLPVVFTPTGLKYKGRYWMFRELKSFSIFQSGGHSRLHLEPIGRLTRSVSIALPTDDVEKTRDLLSHYLPEVSDIEEDLADRLNRLLRI